MFLSVQVTFDEPVSCPGNDCLRVQKQGHSTKMLGRMAMVDAYTAVYTPTAGLEESTWFDVTASGFVDQNCGAMMAEHFSWSFETVHVPPQVAAAFPAPGATCVPSDTLSWVRFDEAVDTTSPLAYTLSWSGGDVDGSSGYGLPANCPAGLYLPGEGWACGATFTPDATLPEHEFFEANVSGPQDAYGNALAPYQWSFGQVDYTLPEVAWTAPVSGGLDAYPDAAIEAWFGEWLSPTALGNFQVWTPRANPSTAKPARRAVRMTPRARGPARAPRASGSKPRACPPACVSRPTRPWPRAPGTRPSFPPSPIIAGTR